MDIMVSVWCTTYNHFSYIRDALDSFISQQTNFPYEIIVHDDCSTDGTAEILQEYQSKYSEIIKPIFEKENLYSKGIPFARDIFKKNMNGKYVAVCDGDDFWCNPLKIQRQFDYMEAHKDCSLMMHNGYFLNAKNNRKKLINPYPTTEILTENDVIVEGKHMPPTASMFYRRTDREEMPSFFWDAPVGDRTLRLFLLTRGYVYYEDDPMCMYRINVPGSFGKRTASSKEYSETILKRMEAFFDTYNTYTNYSHDYAVQIAKSREYYHYCRRIGRKKDALKTEYFQTIYGPVEKLMRYAEATIPQNVSQMIKDLFIK